MISYVLFVWKKKSGKSFVRVGCIWTGLTVTFVTNGFIITVWASKEVLRNIFVFHARLLLRLNKFIVF